MRAINLTVSTCPELEFLLGPMIKGAVPFEEHACALGDVFAGLHRDEESLERMVRYVTELCYLEEKPDSDPLKRAFALIKDHPGAVLFIYSSEWLKIYLNGKDPLRLWRSFLALESCSENIHKLEQECEWVSEEALVG